MGNQLPLMGAVLMPFFVWEENMGVKLGHTSITCRHCGTMAVVDNADLEAMREHRCPACNFRMTDYELARLKMHYYLMMTQMYWKHWGSLSQYEQFNYDIHLWPHYEHREEGERI